MFWLVDEMELLLPFTFVCAVIAAAGPSAQQISIIHFICWLQLLISSIPSTPLTKSISLICWLRCFFSLLQFSSFFFHQMNQNVRFIWLDWRREVNVLLFVGYGRAPPLSRGRISFRLLSTNYISSSLGNQLNWREKKTIKVKWKELIDGWAGQQSYNPLSRN